MKTDEALKKLNHKCRSMLNSLRKSYLEKRTDTSMAGRVKTSIEKVAIFTYIQALEDAGCITSSDKDALNTYYTM